MAKIVATGKYLTDRITVEVTQEDGTLVITMDDNESPELQKHLEECIDLLSEVVDIIEEVMS